MIGCGRFRRQLLVWSWPDGSAQNTVTYYWYRTVLPNFTPFNATTLSGFRHVRNTSTGRHGQLPMTVPGSLP